MSLASRYRVIKESTFIYYPEHLDIIAGEECWNGLVHCSHYFWTRWGAIRKCEKHAAERVAEARRASGDSVVWSARLPNDDVLTGLLARGTINE